MSKKKANKPTYTGIDDSLNAPVALVQAALALDAAAFIAEKNRDAPSLERIGSVWLQVADRLISLSDAEPEEGEHLDLSESSDTYALAGGDEEYEDPDDPEAKKAKFPVGFASAQSNRRK